MKNIIRTLAISSVLMANVLPTIVEAKQMKKSVYYSDEYSTIKEKGFEVKTISYPEKYSVEKWRKDLNEMFRYEYDPYAKEVLMSFPNVKYGSDDYGSIIQFTKAQMLNKFWHQINTDFKDSNNAKVAFCKYTEDIGVISKSLRVCDKNYDFHNQKNVRVNLINAKILDAPEPPVSNKNKKPM